MHRNFGLSRNNDDFEYIAMKCEQDIIEIVNRILKYE